VIETMDMQTLTRDDQAGSTRVRGIIDLRAYAARAAPARDRLAGRTSPAFADAAATVSAIAPMGEDRVAALRADEFVARGIRRPVIAAPCSIATSS
jgi:hypothetical protein